MRAGPLTVWVNRCLRCRRVLWRSSRFARDEHHDCRHRSIDLSPVAVCGCGYTGPLFHRKGAAG